MKETVIKEFEKEQDGSYITNVITDGPFKQKLVEHMSKDWSEQAMNSVFSNSTKAVLKFVSPVSKYEKMSKLLCLGKVQSGKTAFFISAMALAFDNGYDIAYVIGGTKNNLLSQNADRILEEFSNNEDILIMNINNADTRDIRQRIKCGCKVILMVLKHKSKVSESNLANLENLTSSLADIPSIIVDDEGDEYSPGAKKRPMTVSTAILRSINYIKRGTYLSVTATPQSNLLLSPEMENVSPDDCVLVEPGEGYTGANVFHDSVNNPLVKGVSDTGDFDTGIPQSFLEALRFFILGSAVRALRGDNEAHSMLVHPSANTTIQKIIYDKVKMQLDDITAIMNDETLLGHDDLIEEFKETYEDMKQNIVYFFPSFDDTINQIKKNLNKMRIYQINRREGSDAESDPGMDKFYKYKIYVGGNMLERGITLKNLAVTYIYRSAKENPVDNTLQRARWFGYKKSYLDLCRVYMTNEMKEYFVDIDNHENFLWETIRKFLQTGKPLNEMKRVFLLSNEKLILTRKSVSNTIELGTMAQGYSYSKSLLYKKDEDISKNYKLLEDYFVSIADKPKYYYYGKTGEHKHRYYENLSLKDFYEKVIVHYVFPEESNDVNLYVFKSIIDSINAGLLEDNFTLVKMRDGENQFRSALSTGVSIKELPESYQVTNGYEGDKKVLNDRLSVQVHYVYIDKDRKDKIIPFLVINCPYDERTTKYVTGEFEYGN